MSINLDNAWTIGNGDLQIKLFTEIKEYTRKNKFLVAYDSKPLKDSRYLDRVVMSSKKYYVFVAKEHIPNAPKRFISQNHTAKITDKQTGEKYTFHGTIPEELFDMFLEIYNKQNGRQK